MAPSAWFRTSLPPQLHDDVAREPVEAVIQSKDKETLTDRTDEEAWTSAVATDAASLEQEAMAIA